MLVKGVATKLSTILYQIHFEIYINSLTAAKEMNPL